VGDINLRYFDTSGKAIASDLDDRVVGLALEDFRAIPHVVGIAGGAAKLDAIRGALEGKLVDVLVTDHVTAQRLLESDLRLAEPRAGKAREGAAKKSPSRSGKQGGNR